MGWGVGRLGVGVLLSGALVAACGGHTVVANGARVSASGNGKRVTVKVHSKGQKLTLTGQSGGLPAHFPLAGVPLPAGSRVSSSATVSSNGKTIYEVSLTVSNPPAAARAYGRRLVARGFHETTSLQTTGEIDEIFTSSTYVVDLIGGSHHLEIEVAPASTSG